MQFFKYKIENGMKPLFVAEISANHGGSYKQLLDTVDAAHRAGAHAVKLQTYSADRMTLNFDNKYFKIAHGEWAGKTLHQLYRLGEMSELWTKNVFAYARSMGMNIFSTPFSPRDVDILELLGCEVYKVASFEITYLELIDYIAKTGKPIILSTGMASMREIKTAYDAATAFGSQVTLLHCISDYPTKLSNSNLARIARLRKSFKCPVGISDHSISNLPAMAAVALGAPIIEKHFKLSNKVETIDSKFSITPIEFENLISECTLMYRTIGIAVDPIKSDNINFRRSLFATMDIKKDQYIDSSNVKVVRPGFGLEPTRRNMGRLYGSQARVDIKAGTPIFSSSLKKRY